MFYRANEYPLGLISPYYFLWCQDSLSSSTSSSNGETGEVKKRVLWLWFHPAAFDYALSALERSRGVFDVIVTSRKEQVQRFELSGPTAHSILRRVLKVSAILPRGEAEMDTDQSLTVCLPSSLLSQLISFSPPSLRAFLF
jgi:hypothetical protein